MRYPTRSAVSRAKKNANADPDGSGQGSCEYKPDERQVIADSWSRSIDDHVARQEWGWQPEYNLARMTADMLAKLRQRQ